MGKSIAKFRIGLDEDFTDCLNELRNEYDEVLEDLNGLSKNQLNFTDFIDHFVDNSIANVADNTIDPNANVSTKDICSLTNEMNKSHLKLLAFNKIFYEIKKKYGLKSAKDWLNQEWCGYLYMHDASTASIKPYCFAYDIEDLVTKGLYFIDTFNHKPPRHLVTYTDFVGEFVSWTSNRASGACGLPSFLIYSFYFWKKDVENGYYTKSPEEYRDQEFQRIIYKLNQPYLRVNQSAFTNFTIYDHPYMEALFGGKEFPDGTFMIDYIDEIVEYQKSFMEVVSETRSLNMMTFPVLTYSLLRKDGKFVDEEFARWCCNHNMKWNDSNFFVSEDITSLSSCCRLVSDVKNLGYFNSIGGTALEVGSVKCNTVNLARIAYESDSESSYLLNLRPVVQSCLESLDAVRHIISRNIDKGMLPNYSKGIISMEHQYNTIGIIGIYETLSHFGYTYKDEFGNTYYSDGGLKFAQDILSEITKIKQEFEQSVDYQINIEETPAERAAAILMEKDRYFYPEIEFELPLYGNQWIPLAVQCTLQEKIRVASILDKACSGGSISHINLDAPLTDFDAAWHLLNYIADQGVTYFAFCVRISSCENNHGFYGDVCPICGQPMITTYQRIVGYLVPEKSYSKERRAEFKLRDWMELNKFEE